MFFLAIIKLHHIGLQCEGPHCAVNDRESRGARFDNSRRDNAGKRTAGQAGPLNTPLPRIDIEVPAMGLIFFTMSNLQLYKPNRAGMQPVGCFSLQWLIEAL
jgi:hypothetical protein